MNQTNINTYKVKESLKKDFEKILKKVHYLKEAKVTKKKKNKYYTYQIQSNAIQDYWLMVPDKKNSNKVCNKYENYQNLLNMLIIFKDRNPRVQVANSISGKPLTDIKKLKPILNSHPRVLKYYYNKYMNCLTAFIQYSFGLFVVDIYPDKILESLVFNFDLFKGFFLEKSNKPPLVQEYLKSLNKIYYKWVKNKFEGRLFDS